MTISARRTAFALASFTIVVMAAITFRSAAYARNADILAWAFTFDLTLTIPLMYYAFVVRPEIARPITMIPVFVICVAIARVMVPHEQQQFLHDMRFLTVPLDLITMFLVARRLARTGKTGNGIVDRIVGSEVAILRYGLFAWRQPDAPGFTVHKRNDWGTIVICFVVAILAESLGVHLLVQHWSVKAAWIVTALDLYGILWLIGDYHALRLHVTTIEDGVLHLRYGMRWNADIPLANIAAIRPAPADWKRKGVLKVAMLDEPALLIELREPVTANGLMGITRRIEAIAILPDDPEEFVRTAGFSRQPRGLQPAP
jgi:hypothetical protein